MPHKNSREYNRNYYMGHSEKIKRAAKDWKKRHPEKVKAQKNRRCKKDSRLAKDWRSRNRQHICVHSARKRCLKTDMPFELDRDWVNKNYTGYCVLTGLPFKNDGARSPYSVSLDRIDNQKGYLKSNCRFILFGLNTFKGSGTDADMFFIAEQLVKGFKA